MLNVLPSLNSEGTLKVYLHDQEMVGWLPDRASISTNLVKKDIARKEEGKEDGANMKGDPEK